MRRSDVRGRCWLIGLLLGASLLAGCNQAYVVDRIHIVGAVGFDKKGNEYLGSALFSVYDPKERMEMTYGTGQTTGLMIAQMQKREDKPLKSGKVRTLLFSKELAASGIDMFIHSFCRDPIISPLLIAAVTEQPPDVILKQQEKKAGSRKLHNLIKQNVKAGNLAETNLNTFLFNYYGAGRDAFLPYIGLDSDKSIEVKGMALFRGDRMALLLGKSDSIWFKMLQPKYGRGFLPVTQDGSDKVIAVVSIVSGRTKMQLKATGNEKEIVFQSKIIGFLKDQSTSVHIRERSSYLELERQMEKHIETELGNLLARMQAAGVDPLGIGDFVRARDRAWEEKSFYDEIYPRIRLTVKVDVTLKESGIGS